MKRIVSTLFLILALHQCFAQTKIRPLGELINKTDQGWPIVQKWIDSATNKVEILSADSIKAKEALFETQVTTRSLMGAIIYKTGGLLIDNGWIRILGSGNAKLKRTIPDWNKGKSFDNLGERPSFLLIADDAIGGFFAMDGGKFGKEIGKIYYLSPDDLEWEPLDMTYTEFLLFCFNGDVTKFYKGLRWKTWKEDIVKLDGDKVFNFVPPLWSKQGKDINKGEKMPVPISEQYEFNMQVRKQLGFDK